MTLDNRPWFYQDFPALVAHRGDAQCFPENTWVALNAAVEAGAGFIEFDVQLSKDGIPFLLHDASFDRTAGVSVSPFDLTMAEISKISVGEPDRFSDLYAEEKPISLAELCVRLNAWTKVHSFIEIKRQSVEQYGLERVVDQVLESIQALNSPHTIISFREDVVRYVRQVSGVSTGWVIREWNDISLDKIQNMDLDYVFCNLKKIPEDEDLPNTGSRWVLYEIRGGVDAEVCRDKGASLIETMAVQPMLQTLTKGVKAG